ncbi:MAG: HEAT repeat domain-containing protein [Candidatus Aminicenantes bacterium]|nr:HEAT repeat domain-containing protein [Candidatus Aminicenantes bacterium]
MSFSKKIIITATLVLLTAAFPLSSFSQVSHHPHPTADLIERWDWAVQEAGKLKLNNGFWIGYSIKRLMWEHQYICSTDEHTITSSHFPNFLRGEPLEKILSGKVTYTPLSDEEKVKLEARRALDNLEDRGKPQQKVWKDVAILIKFSSSSSRIPETFRVSNLYLPFDPEGLPIFWLDKAEDAHSISILSDIYESKNSEKLKKRTLTVVGLHGTSDQAVSFFEKVLNSKEPDTLRAVAALELGDQDHERAVKLLHQAAVKDHSSEVRRRSVYGLEDIELPSAADALIDIAQNCKEGEIRKRAIDCLADIASKKTAAALKDIAYKDGDTDIQKRAVYALEDLPRSEGIPYLIDIAKTHHNLTVRKAAIYCLGDSDDYRALQALIDIIKK